LTGNGGNLMAKKAAERDARNTVGVHRVTNLVKVSFNESRAVVDSVVAGIGLAILAGSSYAAGSAAGENV
jgi:hypothetical protein